MTDQTRNVELVIRAKNLSKKTLNDVRKEIEDVNKAIDEQVAASKRGEGSLKDLERSYGRLEDAMKALLQQQALVKNFEAQEAQLKKLQDRLGAASTRLREHQAAMEGTENVTKRQVTQLTSYQNAVGKLDGALAKQVERMAATRKEGEALGLNMVDLTRAQDDILSTGRQLSDSYDNQSTAVRQFGDNTREAARSAKALEEAAKFDALAKQAADMVKAGEYTRFWTTELDRAEQAQRNLADTAKRVEREMAETRIFEEKARDAQKLVAAGEYTRFWVTELEKLDVAERQLADNRALNDMADKAVAAARGYKTLGGASKSLIQNNRQMASSLRDILDPSAKVRTTLSGVEEEIDGLANSIKAIKGPVKDYEQQVKQLADAQKRLSSQASAIDAYDRQVTALRAARAEYAKNRAEMLQYATAMRSADTPTAEMQAELRRLQGALATSSQSLRTNITQTRALRDPLRAAGVDTSKLASEQERLTGSARRSVGALNNLREAVRRYGNETDIADKKTRLFGSGGRTTLSFLQRMRGEVLSLVAAYVGLQGAIGLSGDAIEASNTKFGIQNQLALSVGNDAEKIGAEYKYIREQADRIGISFEEAARGYAKFSAAASLAGRGQQEIRYVAESFLEVARVANLSADEINGTFKALEQIYSKGNIQAEELRGQLGDRLFGAFEMAAIALKDQFPDLSKAMKDGLVTSDQLLKIAEQYRKTVADQLPGAMENLAANQARMNSAMYDFKVLLADTGYADQYAILVNKITEFLKSDDGAKFAKSLGDAFGAVVKFLSFVLDHLAEIELALKLTFGIVATTMVANLAAAITTRVIPALLAMQAQLTATGFAGATAMTRIRSAFLLLAAAFAGWQIGTYLAKEFDWAQKLGIAFVIGMEKLFANMKAGAKIAFAAMGTSWKDTLITMVNLATKAFRSILGIYQKVASVLGQDWLAEGIESVVQAITIDYTTETSDKIKAIQDQLKKDLTEIDRIGFEMWQDVGAKAPGAAGAPVGQTDKPDIPPTIDTEKDEKGHAKLVAKRIALMDQLVRALEAAEGKIQKNEKFSLEQRMAAIDTEYAKVFRKIEELSKLPGGADVAATMRETLTGYVEQLKVQEQLKFNSEQMAAAEKRVNDLISLRTQLLQNIENQRRVGGVTDNEAKSQVALIDAEYVPQINAAVAATLALGEANRAAFADQASFDLWVAKIQAIPDSLKQTQDELYSTAQVNEDLAAGMAGSFDQFAQAIANGENALGSLRDAFLTFVADFLKKIALMIIQQIILNALQNSSIGGMISGAVSGATKAHSGAVVGSGGAGGVRVNTNSQWFANAPKYHTGGIVGLAADEYPAILQRNEEVLAADDPANILNGGNRGGGQSAAPVQDITVNNMVDAASFMSAALAGSDGRKMIMNVLQAERSQLKSLVR